MSLLVPPLPTGGALSALGALLVPPLPIGGALSLLYEPVAREILLRLDESYQLVLHSSQLLPTKPGVDLTDVASG